MFLPILYIATYSTVRYHQSQLLLTQYSNLLWSFGSILYIYKMGVEEALLFGDLRVPVFLTIAVLGPFLSTWLVTSWKARRAIALAESTPSGLKRPPTLPYAVPFIGHLIQFMWDGTSFLSNAA